MHPVDGCGHGETRFRRFYHQDNNVEADQRHHYYFVAGSVDHVKDAGLALVLRTQRGQESGLGTAVSV